MGASKPFLDFGLSLSVIWRQILPATSLSLHIPTLPAPSCPSSLAAEDAGGHGLFVHSKTKLRWLIRTRHAWLAAYQKERKSLFYAAPAGQLERAGGWWFCCGEALPPPSAASQAGLAGPGEQGTTTNTPRGNPAQPSILLLALSVCPQSVPLAGGGALLGCWCPVSDAAVTPTSEWASTGSGLAGAKFKGTGWYRRINKGMVCKQ